MPPMLASRHRRHPKRNAPSNRRVPTCLPEDIAATKDRPCALAFLQPLIQGQRSNRSASPAHAIAVFLPST